MASEQNRRIEEAVNSMVNKLFDTDLRKLQAEMHKCSAKCCEDTSLSVDAVNTCTDACSKRLQSVSEKVAQEMNDFQKRIERCVSGCQDKVRDQVGDDASKVAQFQGQFDTCVTGCSDEAIAVLPTISKRIRDYVKKSG